MKKNFRKRALAILLTAAMVFPIPFQSTIIPAYAETGGVGNRNDRSWDPDFEADAAKQGYYATGLNWAADNGPTHDLFYIYWAIGGKTGGDGCNYSLFDHIRMSCVGQHTGASHYTYSQAFSQGVVKMDGKGEFYNEATGEKTQLSKYAPNTTFTDFLLLAALGYASNVTSGLTGDQYMSTYYYGLCINTNNMVYYCTDKAGFTGNWLEDARTYMAGPHEDCYLRDGWPATDPMAIMMYKLAGFNSVDLAAQQFAQWWMVAYLHMNSEFTESGDIIKSPTSVVPSDTETVLTYQFDPALIQSGLQNVLSVTVDGGTYAWDGNNLVITFPAGSEISGHVDVLGNSWDSGTMNGFPNLAKANVAYWDYYCHDEGKASDGNNSEGFGKSQRFMSAVFPETFSFYFSPNASSSDPTVEVHRYDHYEQWTATYNINLIKYDSETGQPLENSWFDVLEAFDDSQLDETDLEADESSVTDTIDAGSLTGTDGDDVESNYDGELGAIESPNTLRNMANDSGSQFERWDDPNSDPCDKDKEVTNDEGYLFTNGGNGAKEERAHTDVKQYTYNKGFCGGHPAPEIEETPLTGDPEQDEAIEEENEEKAAAAWEEWFKEVETCIELMNEGGFFHAINEGEAQAAMEADRDKFYEDFISLVYDYSAVEIGARTGYIIHGEHTDDIPLEWRRVTSSEYKDMQENGISHTGGSSDGGGDEEEGADISNIEQPSIGSISYDEVPVTVYESTRSMDSNTESASNAEETVERRINRIPSYRTETSSNAEPSEDLVEEKPATVIERIIGSAKSALSNLMRAGDDDEEDDDGGGGGDGLYYELVTEESIADVIDPNAHDIIDWTFVVYDHRTEGEIHINKRDLNLSEAEGYDHYAAENGDGSLEGAVYGLFAQNDIVHPDGKTGVVYKAGDLVSVATTDRNGDASFIVFTEAPGSHYNYETGKIETYDWNTEAPTNLYRARTEAEAVDDIEKFEGHNPDNSEITAGPGADLDDTGSPDDTFYDEWYKKYSTNQLYDDTYRLDDTSGFYPISNNEKNNGNCWIGRPLIVSGYDTAAYYVKELSRSEGYELSVYGKDMEYTNGTNLTGDDIESIILRLSSITTGQSPEIGRFAEFSITSKNTNKYKVTITGLPEGVRLKGTKLETYWDDTLDVGDYEQVDEPLYGPYGNFVMINGQKVEAYVGQMIDLPNGEQAEVKEVSSPDPLTLTVSPNNHLITEMPVIVATNQRRQIDDLSIADFIKEYNSGLIKNSVYLAPSNAEKAPYLLIRLAGNTFQDGMNSLNTALSGNTPFNKYNVRDVKLIGGSYYAIVNYNYTENGSVPVTIYDENKKIVYVRTNITYEKDGEETTGYIYVPYSEGEYEIVSSDGSFVTKAKMKEKGPSVNKVVYPQDMSDITFQLKPQKQYWVYSFMEQQRDNQGNLMTQKKLVYVPAYGGYVTREVYTDIPMEKQADGTYTFTVELDSPEEVTKMFRFAFDNLYYDGQPIETYIKYNCVISVESISEVDDSTYIVQDQILNYPGEDTIVQDAGTIADPVQVYERTIRQQVKVIKDIQTLPETKEVWYCAFCGHENETSVAICESCNRVRSVEETKTVSYAHDTYSAVHTDNLSTEKKTLYDSVLDWLTSLLTGGEAEDSAKEIPNFRFKVYLKSNLERLYRDEDGNVVWIDRNGNNLTPNYKDTNADGNYDTFTWTRTDQADSSKSEIDFPEKQIVNDTTLASANVQKIYTEVKHLPDSTTTGDISNTTWADYDTPQGGDRNEVGSLTAYSTSQDGQNGVAVSVNDSLYSYDGKNVNTAVTDRLNADQNDGYTRVLESTVRTIEDGAGKTREVSTYNYKKFFDAIYAANTDKWDNDMFASGKNYPGQHWFETFYEKYQMDDTDQDFTLPNVDKSDVDGTAGGDRDTSFKPFRWIREKLFGDSFESKSEYPSVHDNDNLENEINTSLIAHENAEASDAVRQFAIDWYLKDEVAKLVINNGYDEDQAKDLQIDGTNIIVNETAGPIDYSEQIYDVALYNALAKAVNYLKPFYDNDLDTIYSVEWDREANGGDDSDYTTLNIGTRDVTNDNYYAVSSYLPYGTYVLVEQQPERIDDSINDFETRNYKTDIPKEIILPALYENDEVSNTFDSYEKDYFYNTSDTPEDLAAKYQIRFNEEWAGNHTDDLRHYVIRAHNYDGDFEVYKYGLETDKLTDTITYPGSSYTYQGYEITQDELEPLKDYYNPLHRVYGEAITTADGANASSHYLADEIDKDPMTSNGTNYAPDAIEKRYHYGSISENFGTANNVLFPAGPDTDDNNPSGFYFEDGVKTMTGNQTAYEGKYAAALVPWSVTTPADPNQYSAESYSGYADMGFRNTFYVTKLRIEKLDSETGENISNDDAIFALYAASRYTSQDEVDEAIANGAPETTKIGDVKFFMEDTQITGSYEFLKAMKADNIQQKRRIFGNEANIFSGIVKAGTPVCKEEERIMLYDEEGSRFGDMTVYTTDNDVYMLDEDKADKSYSLQNTGYFVTPQPVGAGVYVLAEIKPPTGYVRTNPVAIEVYSDNVSYYVDGDMYAHVNATVYHDNLIKK